MTTIALGSNIYGNNHRQDVAIDSWLHLNNKHDVQLYNVQPAENPVINDRIQTLDVLSRHSGHVTDGNKELPFVNDIFNALASVDCDYFIYCNSDVIVNSNLIKHIKQNEPACVACSRLDIHDIDSFDRVLNKQITPVRYEIAGFDAFVFSKKWYNQHMELFRDYLIGQPCWDQVYATIIKIYGDGVEFSNKLPPHCFHIHHEQTWQLEDTPEKQFNKKQSQHYFDRLLCKIFDTYLKSVLINRQPMGLFITPIDNEKQIESNFFNKFSCPNQVFA